MSDEYAPGKIEGKWQAHWDRHGTFVTPNPGDASFDPDKPKFYILDMFPYPSGTGLHVGHPEGYTATDIVARYRRMRGDNVLHPMGWDSFGLPAEQHAVETGQHPTETTTRNIATFRRQMAMLGFSYDWSREIATSDPAYYRWTQWIFLQLFNSWYDDAADKARPISELPIGPDIAAQGDAAVRTFVDSHRLAYLAEVPVNWCPALGTVLSNEEVTNEGTSDRGHHPVYRRPLRQWMLRITKYADRLESDLEPLDWPESVKLMQRNWVGRSEGADVLFKLDGPSECIKVYTTRPDTLFGATYMVLAPEHPLVEKITRPAQREAVNDYCRAAMRRSDLSRTAEAKEKTGVATGAHAISPVWPEGDPRGRIPIWVADYVLISYGTGAIMCVPAHDTRDFEFANQFELPIAPVVVPPEGWTGQDHDSRLEAAFTGEGTAVNSPPAAVADAPGKSPSKEACDINGLPTTEAKAKITRWLEHRGLGKSAVNYKLRDWLFSRQRYWGEPFPILHGPDGELVALDESELPLELPEVSDYRPTAVPDDSDAMPDPPLGRATAWATVQRGGKTYHRELNTMPQWAGSCWYYLRFLDSNNDAEFCSRQAERYWMTGGTHDEKKPGRGIDLYLGGAEHAVLHLLYARFWHKVLYDLGHVSTPEPFAKLYNQGMIRARAYKDDRGQYVGYDDIDFREDGAYHKADGGRLSGAIEKMSKSLKNVVNPEVVVREYGADSLRLYEMFMGPLDASKPWNPRDVPGVFRFLQRVWRLITGDAVSVLSDQDANPGLERAIHRTIKKVTDDIERLSFNTAISAMMEFVNEAYRAKTIHRSAAERFVLLLSPFAPHVCEELWQRLLGNEWKNSLALEPWPTFDPAMIVEDEIQIAVQVNGKLAGRVTVRRDTQQDVIEAAAMADEKVVARIAGATVVKKILVPGRLLNLIVKK